MAKQELLNALNIMLGLNRQNNKKNQKVIEWFTQNFDTGRASIVTEGRQVVNRIPEQFKHHDKHVIFVYLEDEVKDKLIEKIPKYVYPQLETVLLVKAELDPTDQKEKILEPEQVKLMVKNINHPIVDFYKSNFSINDSDIDHITSRSQNISYRPTYNASKITLSKPFILLAGISGTGKTRFVREQAKASGCLTETYCLTAVRPDWHEPSDLLGYVSRLTGEAEYITTDILCFIIKAWKAIFDAGVEVGLDDEGKLVVSGKADDLARIPPFWLCLDEMNLAPVEQYFADYLSVLETREWNWSEEEFIYHTDSLLKPNVLSEIHDVEKFREKIGLNHESYDDAWGLFKDNGIGVPFNLLVAGTVNMDETTHGFSRKVLDRALSFDFGEFFPNNYNEYFESSIQNKILSYPTLSSVQISDLPDIDNDGNKTITFLKEINDLLNNTPFKLAYRALNELLLAVVMFEPKNEMELMAVWDDFLMCKVLPRIEGDSDKLVDFQSSESILKNLEQLLMQKNLAEKDDSTPATEQRLDLFRELKNTAPNLIEIPWRSVAKLRWMQSRLENSGFTSFWP